MLLVDRSEEGCSAARTVVFDNIGANFNVVQRWAGPGRGPRGEAGSAGGVISEAHSINNKEAELGLCLFFFLLRVQPFPRDTCARGVFGLGGFIPGRQTSTGGVARNLGQPAMGYSGGGLKMERVGSCQGESNPRSQGCI